MRGGPETRQLEAMLRRRGTSAAGDPEIEREIFARYTDECAVMVLDASGFTRVTQRFGIIHFLSLVVAMRDQALPCLERHDAIATWAHADNIYAIFHKAKDAVQAALAIQDTVMSTNEQRPETDQLPVCIGIGYGRLLRIGKEDVFGDQMNLASKLGEDIAGPDEILITEACYDQVRPELTSLAFENRSQRQSGVEIPYYAVCSVMAPAGS